MAPTGTSARLPALSLRCFFFATWQMTLNRPSGVRATGLRSFNVLSSVHQHLLLRHLQTIIIRILLSSLT
ncbi:unnamed protein product [Caenorhabditis nigoni]